MAATNKYRMQYWNLEDPPLQEWENEMPAMKTDIVLIVICDEYHFSKKNLIPLYPIFQFPNTPKYLMKVRRRIISDPR